MKNLRQKLIDILDERYGPLLTMDQLADLLGRSTNGLRLSLRKDTAFSRAFNATSMKQGRRKYFLAELIAELLSKDIKPKPH